MEANKEMQNNLTPNSTVPQSSQPQFQSQPQLQPKPSKAKKKLSKQAILAIKINEIPEDQTPELFTADGISANDIFIVTKENID